MNKVDYRVHIQPLPAEEGGGYVAMVPDLPGCMSDGETPQEALANVLDAIDAWLDCARETGRPIPRPTREPTYA
jgi:predicted RNase H-like HicB family nuclease